MSNRYIMPEKRLSIFVKAAIITFICFCIASIVGQQFTYNNCCQEQLMLQNELDDKTEELEELQELLEGELDDDYVKKSPAKVLDIICPMK